jgi:DNA-entry nuclease
MSNHDDFVDEFIEYQIFEDSMKKSDGGNLRKRNSGCLGCGTGTIIMIIALIISFSLGACSGFDPKSDVEIDSTYTTVEDNTTIPVNTTIAPTTKIPTSVEASTVAPTTTHTVSLADIPAYSGDAYIEINGNAPFFSTDEYTTSSFEQYSNLDSLGRCGVAYACIGTDIMPTEK